MSLVLDTELGVIRLTLHPEAAPVTCEHVRHLVAQGTFADGAASFYRSDFVIQFGVHGSMKARPKLPVNETKQSGMSNVAGTAAFAHWDVPDCGDTEIFINLKANTHLDAAYGGFCVFASVSPDDAASAKTIETIASEIPKIKNVPIRNVTIEG